MLYSKCRFFAAYNDALKESSGTADALLPINPSYEEYLAQGFGAALATNKTELLLRSSAVSGQGKPSRIKLAEDAKKLSFCL